MTSPSAEASPSSSASSRVARHVAAFDGDTKAAERAAARTVVIGPLLLPIVLGMMGVFVSLFLPHSGRVIGLDVLFFSDTARAYVTTVPERIYIWLAIIGPFLLTVATVVTRSMGIALAAWATSGAAMFYSLFAIWMRQSRPPTEPGSGPSIGLVIGAVSVTIVAVCLSIVVFRRSALQRAMAELRSAPAAPDAVASVQDEILHQEQQRATENSVLVDDRRARAARRRRTQQ
ncbi:hypothetical protein C1Y63_10920 [Corynebacterium sp. 13CS0277]|uniref:Rv2732c family membrane protein n=1 Tax=Corynebacterium sp. 13CS0277 TaxID=2071994 RepID=UPI000D04384A|nr:hypothetical protein [Corynebacterium sp. 13CS0277]PRQ10553.1 hypothetical protein C1Y63_10920 [Corynebacterium sp. 13CS0277]